MGGYGGVRRGQGMAKGSRWGLADTASTLVAMGDLAASLPRSSSFQVGALSPWLLQPVEWGDAGAHSVRSLKRFSFAFVPD